MVVLSAGLEKKRCNCKKCNWQSGFFFLVATRSTAAKNLIGPKKHLMTMEATPSSATTTQEVFGGQTGSGNVQFGRQQTQDERTEEYCPNTMAPPTSVHASRQSETCSGENL